VIIQPSTAFAIHGAWLPALPAGMTRWELNELAS